MVSVGTSVELASRRWALEGVSEAASLLSSGTFPTDCSSQRPDPWGQVWNPLCQPVPCSQAWAPADPVPLCLVSTRLPGPQGRLSLFRDPSHMYLTGTQYSSTPGRPPSTSLTVGRAQAWEPLWGRRPLGGRAGSLPCGCCLPESCRCPQGRGTGCPTLSLFQREGEGNGADRGKSELPRPDTAAPRPVFRGQLLKEAMGEGQGAGVPPTQDPAFVWAEMPCDPPRCSAAGGSPPSAQDCLLRSSLHPRRCAGRPATCPPGTHLRPCRGRPCPYSPCGQ